MSRRHKIDQPNQNRSVADPKEVEKAKRDARLEEKERLRNLERLCGDQGFIKYMWEIMDFCGIFEDEIPTNSGIYVLAGLRKAGMKIHNDILWAKPEAYLDVLRHNIKALQAESTDPLLTKETTQ